MTDPRMTVGQAIDQIARALEWFDDHQKKMILSAVCALLEIQPAKSPAEARASAAAVPVAPALPAVGPRPAKEPQAPVGIDLAMLKEEMQPSSAREMACLVAYYLCERAPERERKNTVTNADLEKYFKQAGYRLPERLNQLLPDSKKAGYFEASARGEYRLTRVGYNLVVANLPAKAKDSSGRPSYLA